MYGENEGEVQGVLSLNETNVYQNPVVWSHDPSMMWDPVTKLYYSYSTDIYRPEEGLREKNRNSGAQFQGFNTFYL